jgi:hypothetical protein
MKTSVKFFSLAALCMMLLFSVSSCSKNKAAAQEEATQTECVKEEGAECCDEAKAEECCNKEEATTEEATTEEAAPAPEAN